MGSAWFAHDMDELSFVRIYFFIIEKTATLYNIGNVSYIVEWLNENICDLLKESEFTLPINASSSIDFLKKVTILINLLVANNVFKKNRKWKAIGSRNTSSKE